MKNALMTTIEKTISTWMYGEFPNPGHWQDVVYPINSVINFIVPGEGYNPPADTVVMEVEDSVSIGDVINI